MNSGLLVKEGLVTEEEITIEEFADDLEYALWVLGIQEFKVTEFSQNRGKRINVVRGLHIEIEEEIICCSDWDNILLKNYSVLTGFIKQELQFVKIVTDINAKYGELHFKNCYVLIEAA